MRRFKTFFRGLIVCQWMGGGAFSVNLLGEFDTFKKKKFGGGGRGPTLDPLMIFFAIAYFYKIKNRITDHWIVFWINAYKATYK